jgi:hypothetical protein
VTVLRPPRDIQAGPSTFGSSFVTVIVRWLTVLWLRIAPWAGPLLLLAVFGAVALFSWLRPVYGWDTVAYMAAALKGQFANFEDVHRQVYAALKAGMPAGDYQAITAGDEYRVRQFTDPAALQSMIGMYDVKWLYVNLVALLGPVYGWFNAFLMINWAALTLLFLSVWAWLSRFKLLACAPLVAGLFLALGLPDVYRAFTPDFLALALFTSGVFLLDRGRVAAALAPLTLAVLTRPDSAAAVCMIGLVFMLMRDPRWREGAIMFGLAVAAYLFAKVFSTSPGWWAHLWFSTYHIQNTMESFTPAFSLHVYATAFAYNFARAMTENTWLGFYVAAIIASFWIVSKGHNDAPIRHPRMVLVCALVLSVAAKFVLFPLHDARTYLPILFPLMLLIGAQIRLNYSQRIPD